MSRVASQALLIELDVGGSCPALVQRQKLRRTAAMLTQNILLEGRDPEAVRDGEHVRLSLS